MERVGDILRGMDIYDQIERKRYLIDDKTEVEIRINIKKAGVEAIKNLVEKDDGSN